MRHAVVCLVLLSLSVSAFAAKPVTIDQLRQQLTAIAGKPDVDAAWQIADLKLAERLSPAHEAELEKGLPGEKSREALRVLADESQFVPPPASEIPAQPAPDFATQRAIMGRVVNYVLKAIPQLPNFLATRQTTHFENSPQRNGDLGNKYVPLHWAWSASAQVSYRGGREVVISEAKAKTSPSAKRGMVTWGEFGPILSAVLLDAARNKLGWLRWEPGKSGPLAVFAFSVPRKNSHYEVEYCCVQDSEGRSHTFHELEGYEGDMTVDPATGAILRLMVKAQMKAGEPVSRADLLVEYEPVEIGGKSYICPVRSVALSRASLEQERGETEVPRSFAAGGSAALVPILEDSPEDATEQTLLNVAEFSGYHVFRAETRVLTAAEAGMPSPEALPAEPPMSATSAAPAPPVSATPAPAAAKSPVESAAAAPSPAPVEAKPAPAAVDRAQPEANAEPELSATDLNGPPDVPAGPQTPLPNTGFTVRTTVRLVEVPVAVFDKKGRPITDLKPGELEVYDNGRKQDVKFFGQAGAGTLASAGGTEGAEAVFTNRSAGMPAATAAEKEAHTTILLIDSSHVAFADLTNARQQILRFLKTAPADEQVGLYVLHRVGFEALLEPTEDHAQVAARLAAWMPNAQDLEQAQHEEDRNRQNMDYVEHVTDLLYVNGNIPTGKGDAYYSVDPQLRSLGDTPSRTALAGLQGVGRHLAAIPGQKSLVWIASDNVLADFSDKAPSNERGDKNLGPLELLDRETLNEAHVSLYPLDASQLEAGGVGAGLEAANVQMAPGTNPQMQIKSLPLGLSQEAGEALAESERDVNPGRLKAQLQQDSHPIQGVFRDLATATGGQALRRASDIAAELSSIVADGRAAYLLSFSPDTQADGKYHVLTVKCLRKNVTLRYRNGYLYAEEPATMKDRFREAVWQPRDENEIGLKAELVHGPVGDAVRLNIAAADLEMAEQAGRRTDKVDVFVVMRDDSGLHASVAGKRLGLALMPATYQRDLKDGMTVEEKLPKMPSGVLVRLIVIDENSQRIGSVTVNREP